MPKLHYWKRLASYPSWAPSLIWHPDGDILACCGIRDTIELWDVTKSKLIDRVDYHHPDPNIFAVNPDWTVFACANDTSMSSYVSIFNKFGDDWHTDVRHDDFIWSLSFSPDGQTLASGAGEVRIWNAASGHLLTELEGHYEAAFSPKEPILARACLVPIDGGKRDYQQIKLWNMISHEERSFLPGPLSGVMRKLEWLASGTLIAAAGADEHAKSTPFTFETVIVWDAKSGEKLNSWHTDHGIQSFTCARDNNILVASGFYPSRSSPQRHGRATLWDAQSGEALDTLITTGSLNPVALNADGSLLAGAYDHAVHIWRIKD